MAEMEETRGETGNAREKNGEQKGFKRRRYKNKSKSTGRGLS